MLLNRTHLGVVPAVVACEGDGADVEGVVEAGVQLRVRPQVGLPVL